MRSRLGVLVAAGLFCSAAFAVDCPFQTHHFGGFAGIYGVVLTSVEWDADGDGPGRPVLALGGFFGIAGNERVQNVVIWDGTEFHALGAGVDYVVYEMTVYRNELIVGGHFKKAGEADVPYLACWNGTSWRALGEKRTGAVIDMAVHNDELYVANRAADDAEVKDQVLASWNGSAWTLLKNERTFNLNRMIVYKDELILAGLMEDPNTPGSRCFIARWNTADKTWSQLGGSLDNAVMAAAIHDGKLVIGGHFTKAGELAVNRVAAWDGTAWSAFGEGLEDAAVSLASYNGSLVAAGRFWMDDPNNPGNALVVRWNGSAWERFGTGIVGEIWGKPVAELNVYDGALFAGGDFRVDDGSRANSLARLDANDVWRPLNRGLDNMAYALTEYQGELITGGFFTIGGDPNSRGIARWDGAAWDLLGGGLDGDVIAAAVYQGELVVGGIFTSASGVPAKNIARWDGTAWRPLGAGLDNAVYTLTVHDGQLIAGGNFSRAGDVDADYIARWNGSEWSALAEGFDASVVALAVYRGELVAAGGFTKSGLVDMSAIARWTGSGWAPLEGGVGGWIYDVAVWNDKLIVGGAFEMAGGSLANNIAQWNGAFWSPLGAGMEGPSFDPAVVYALAVYSGELVAGGMFPKAGGVEVKNLARWNGSMWRPYASGVDEMIVDLLPWDGKLIAAGAFMTANDKAVSAFVVGWTSPAPVIVQQPASQSLSSGQGTTLTVAAAGNEPFTYVWEKNGVRLIEGHPCTGTTTAELVIATLVPDDSGEYRVIVSDSCGAVRSEAATLVVTCEAASIVSEPGSMKVTEGATATLEVVVEGSGPISYQWRKNNANIVGAKQAVLTLSPVKKSDAGMYQCLISNACSETQTKKFEVSVGNPPRITIQPMDVARCTGFQATFSVEATGASRWQWRKNGANLAGATNASYTVWNVTAADAGAYACVVGNDFGETVSNAATLTVRESLTWYLDADGDGFGDDGSPTMSCSQPGGYVAAGGDCDDHNAAVHPGAADVCGEDRNCDGVTPSSLTFYRDADGDGYGDLGEPAQGCTAPAGYVAQSGDCNDGDAAVHPGVLDCGNGVDDDCDGLVDEDADACQDTPADADDDGVDDDQDVDQNDDQGADDDDAALDVTPIVPSAGCGLTSLGLFAVALAGLMQKRGVKGLRG